MSTSASATRLACTLCGRSADAADIVPMLDCLVCAGCKPVALQRIREGVALLPEETPKLAFSALSPQGKDVVDQVAAAGAAAARDVLLHRGYRNVVLHEDDSYAASNRTFRRTTSRRARRRELSAKERLKVSRSRSAWPAVRVLFKRTWPITLLAGFLIVMGEPFIWGGAILLAVQALIISWAVLPLTAYRRLIRSIEQARWTDVVKDVRLVRLVNRITPARVPESELIFREAEAAAAAGRLEEALGMMAPLESDPKLERWLFCSRMATVCSLGKGHAKQLQWLERSVEAAPENFAALADLALNTARRAHDPERAAQILARTAQLPSSDLADHAAPLCEGVIAYERGEDRKAVERLLQAEEMMERKTGVFFVSGSLSLCRAYRALALARLGETERAREAFEQARPWMEAWHETELLRSGREAGLISGKVA